MAQIGKYKIPIEIIAEANKCRQNPGCLSDPDFELCKPTYKQGVRVGVLVCGYKADCPYSSHIGSEYVCTCPVRQEIFRKYGV